MDIIIVGTGKVGYTLAEHLSREEHDVTVIDTSDEALRRASDALDVMCIDGNGASIEVLREAGADHADILIAATGLDEVNIVCCLTAKRLGAKYTIARVRNQEYASDFESFRTLLGIDLLINPEKSTAVEISRLLRFPSAAKIEPFYRGRLELMEFRAREEDFFVGKPLSLLSDQVKSLPILFCAADRKGELIIPNGTFVPRAGDRLYLIGAPLGIHEFFKRIGRYAPQVKRELIVGGGRIAGYLAAILSRMNMQVKLIDRSEARCRQLSERLPHCLVICGDGTDQELLDEEGMSDCDGFVALTDRDEDNLLISLYAMQRQVLKVVAKCGRQNYTNIVRDLGLDSVISPKTITASRILQVVRGMTDSEGAVMNALYQIADGAAEAVEFTISAPARCLNIPLRDLPLKRDILVAMIVHEGKTIVPEGSSVIRQGDTVILISPAQRIQDLSDILEPSSLDREGER